MMDKSKEPREWAVNVVYKMVHTVYVTAATKKEAEDLAVEAWIHGQDGEGNGDDYSGDEIDGLDHVSAVEWWPEEEERR